MRNTVMLNGKTILIIGVIYSRAELKLYNKSLNEII